MSIRKYILVIMTIVIFICSAFLISYNWGINKFSDKNTVRSNDSEQNDAPASNLSLGDVVSPNTKIVLKVVYKKSGDIESKEINASEYLGKSREEIEKLGYEVESMSSKELTLVKNIDSYSPNKYVLGVKDNLFAIYKTDENGSLQVLEETDINVMDVATEGDYELLLKGSKEFQFNTKEEAEEKLGEFAS